MLTVGHTVAAQAGVHETKKRLVFVQPSLDPSCEKKSPPLQDSSDSVQYFTLIYYIYSMILISIYSPLFQCIRNHVLEFFLYAYLYLIYHCIVLYYLILPRIIPKQYALPNSLQYFTLQAGIF
jgi:hypothetical protein